MQKSNLRLVTQGRERLSAQIDEKTYGSSVPRAETGKKREGEVRGFHEGNRDAYKGKRITQGHDRQPENFGTEELKLGGKKREPSGAKSRHRETFLRMKDLEVKRGAKREANHVKF